MNTEIKIFPTPYELAEKFAGEFVEMIAESAKMKLYMTVALSGGSTPELLFSVLGDRYSESVPWEYVHFFWGDERCVAPDDKESNYGMTRRKLFEKINIPSINIHRIKGEDEPEKEALRYSEEINAFTASRGGIPRFNLIMLGLGEDGHTVSIFPGQEELFNSDRICEVSVHPVTQQKRITITGRIINNADSVVFFVTGRKKAKIIQKIIQKSSSSEDFPASYVDPSAGVLRWLIDEDSGCLL